MKNMEMKCKLFFLVLLFSCQLACSQNINQSLYDYSFDSVQVQECSGIKFNFTANSCEIIEDSIDLLTLYPKDPSIDSLFIEFGSASPYITKGKAREYLGGDSIIYCFGWFYHITLFRKNVKLCEYDFSLDYDYCYFTPKMLDFILHITGLIRNYHKQYKPFLEYKKGILYNYKKYYKRLCDGSVNFLDEWNRLKEKHGTNVICVKYGLIFAQASINNQRTDASVDLDSLFISEGISKDSLMGKSIFSKEEEYNIIKSWIPNFPEP